MLWRRRVTELAAEYPDVELSHMYIDNAAMQLIRDPKQVLMCSITPCPKIGEFYLISCELTNKILT